MSPGGTVVTLLHGMRHDAASEGTGFSPGSFAGRGAHLAKLFRRGGKQSVHRIRDHFGIEGIDESAVDAVGNHFDARLAVDAAEDSKPAGHGLVVYDRPHSSINDGQDQRPTVAMGAPLGPWLFARD